MPYDGKNNWEGTLNEKDCEIAPYFSVAASYLLGDVNFIFVSSILRF